MKVLVDTNIFVDWLSERIPFAENSEKVILKCTEGEVQGYLAVHTFLDLNYILRKQFTLSEKREVFMMLCKTFTVIAENQQMLESVFKNEAYSDLEDGLQIVCAAEKGVDCIVTRNKKDFTATSIKVLLPEEFLEVI